MTMGSLPFRSLSVNWWRMRDCAEFRWVSEQMLTPSIQCGAVPLPTNVVSAFLIFRSIGGTLILLWPVAMWIGLRTHCQLSWKWQPHPPPNSLPIGANENRPGGTKRSMIYTNLVAVSLTGRRWHVNGQSTRPKRGNLNTASEEGLLEELLRERGILSRNWPSS